MSVTFFVINNPLLASVVSEWDKATKHKLSPTKWENVYGSILCQREAVCAKGLSEPF